MHPWLLLILCIGMCELVGIVSGLATVTAVKTWYRKLKKPWFNPPPFIFGPVWTILYALMGYAFYLIISTPCQNRSIAIGIFSVQLCLNFLWSFLFFYFKKLLLAFGEILVMLLCILLTTYVFWQINPLAGYLMMPYIVWVSFASLLNGSIWWLNGKRKKPRIARVQSVGR